MDYPIMNPQVPHTSHINGGLDSGRLVRVQGTVNQNADRFKINLLCGSNPEHDDVALHFNPRFSENVVVRNARTYSSWGTEERHGTFPFSRGQVFEVLILCDETQFKIAVNGQHFTEFNHRLPANRINHINVEGDIRITMIQFDGLSSSPSLTATSLPSAPSAPMGMGPGYETTSNFPDVSAPPMCPMDPSGGAPGFVPPPYPTGPNYGSPYPPNVPSGYPPPQPYGGAPPQPYPGAGPNYQQYPPPGASNYQPQPGYSPYAQNPYPNQPGPYTQQPGYAQPMYPNPYGQSSGSGGGLMGTAGKLLAGVGLAGMASKVIPGLGPSHGHHSSGGYGHGHGHKSSSGMPAAAAGILGTGLAGALAAKALKPKKMKKNKMLKYGLPIAGVGLGGYALKKGMHGMHGFRRSSSSSSSSSD